MRSGVSPRLGSPSGTPSWPSSFARQRLQHPVAMGLFALQMQAVIASDRSQAISRLPHPTLVIDGHHDALIGVENGRSLAARIPNARLEELSDCGHLPNWEHPERAVELRSNFLG